jgi:hypothetical protein
VEVNSATRHYRKLFLQLPYLIYQDIPQWVPSFTFEARRVFDHARFPFYKHGEAAFLLALSKDGAPVGRVAILKNITYNEFNHEKSAFFHLFECQNDPETACALFEQGARWARARGLNKIIGPKGFSILDGMGLLVKGFEHRPAFGIPYNPAYYPRLIEIAGFIPTSEIVSGYLNPGQMQLPDKLLRVAELVQRRKGIRVVRCKNRRELAQVIPGLQQMYNAALEGTQGNIPLSEEDVKAMADRLLWFADPRLIKIIRKDEELIGFLLAYPDISAAVQRCKGRLFPLGWLDILLEIRRTRWVNINGAAMIEKYRGSGGTALLFHEMYESIREGNFEYADLVQVGADNEKMQLELRGLGIDFYKTHRLYEKPL